VLEVFFFLFAALDNFDTFYIEFRDFLFFFLFFLTKKKARTYDFGYGPGEYL